MRLQAVLIILLLSALVLAEPAELLATKGVTPSSRLAVRLNEHGLPLLVFLQPELEDGDQVWQVTLLRSTCDLRQLKNRFRYPVAHIAQLNEDTQFVDYQAPENVPLFYQLKTETENGHTLLSNVVEVQCRAHRISRMNDPFILIDKLHYVLLLADGDQIKRSFPIALGQNAVNRKLHFDRASTPEGIYRVSNLQSNAQFYKALDLNYPNQSDRVRYEFFQAAGLLRQPVPDIGGEIQVHGEGIEKNWTWGCVALRNQDMDWLFSRPELRVGFPVYIAGSELTPEDLLFLKTLSLDDEFYYRDRLDKLGYQSGRKQQDFVWALSQFQMDNNLTVTGLLDLETASKLRDSE